MEQRNAPEEFNIFQTASGVHPVSKGYQRLLFLDQEIGSRNWKFSPKYNSTPLVFQGVPCVEQHGFMTSFDRNLADRYAGLVVVVMKPAVRRDNKCSHGWRFYLAQGEPKYRSYHKYQTH